MLLLFEYLLDLVDAMIAQHDEHSQVLADAVCFFDYFYEFLLVAAASASEDHAFGEEQSAALIPTVMSNSTIAHQAACYRAWLTADANVVAVLKKRRVEDAQINIMNPKPEDIKEVPKPLLW